MTRQAPIRRASFVFTVAMLVVGLIGLTGCDNVDLAHRKSVAELNQRAAQLLAAGDAKGAVSRLEAAIDLAPDNALMQYNLGIAYQQAGEPEKALAQLERFTKDHAGDERYWDAVQTLAVLHQQAGDKAFAEATEAEENPEGAAKSETVDDGLLVHTPQKSPALLKEEATQHYQQALAALETLREHTSEESHALINDNIKYVTESLAKVSGEMSMTPMQDGAA